MIQVAVVVRRRQLALECQLSQRFADEQRFWLGLAPEGTRKRVERWKPGFWKIAKAAGVTLGEPLSISEEGAAPPPVFRGKMAAPIAGMTPTPVAPGEEQLSITVSVTWAIKGQ